jgi:hypothetical protein
MTSAASKRVLPIAVLIAAAVLGGIVYAVLKDRDGTGGAVDGIRRQGAGGRDQKQKACDKQHRPTMAMGI